MAAINFNTGSTTRQRTLSQRDRIGLPLTPGSRTENPELELASQTLNRGIPQGLSRQQLGTLKSRASAQTRLGTRNALADLALQTGGTSGPLFQLGGARLRAGGAARGAALGADIDISEARNNQELEVIRRNRQATLAGIRNQFSAIANQNALGFARLSQQNNQFNRSFALQEQTQQFNENLALAEASPGFRRSDIDFERIFPRTGEPFTRDPFGDVSRSLFPGL